MPRGMPPAGYSGTPLPKQLGIEFGSSFSLRGAPAGLAAGFVDVKVCAVDETWSGLKFVVRVADRPPARKA